MVHPSSICFYEDNVFELSPGAFSRVLLSPVHMCLGRFLASFEYLSRALQLSLATCSPPIMVNTSLILSRLRCLGRSSLLATWGSSKSSWKHPALMSLPISSLRSMHLSVLCLISLLKAQFFLTSLHNLLLFIASSISVQVLVRHHTDMIYQSIEKMIVCIFWKGCFVLCQPISLFLRAFSLLFLYLPFYFTFVTLRCLPLIILFTSRRSLSFIQSFFGVLQFQELGCFPIKLAYAFTIFLMRARHRKDQPQILLQILHKSKESGHAKQGCILLETVRINKTTKLGQQPSIDRIVQHLSVWVPQRQVSGLRHVFGLRPTQGYQFQFLSI